MTLAAGAVVNSYVGNSGANTYAFTFPVFLSSHVAVTVTSPTGVLSTLANGTDFTVSGLNPVGSPPATGSVVLVSSGQAWLTSGNLTTGWTIQITRTIPLSQTTSLRNQGDFYPESIEATFDLLMMVIQQLNQTMTAPTVPATLTVVTGDITFTTGGLGPVVTDASTGKQWRLMVSNGVFGILEIT